ncbi:hypothetical protein LTS03_008833 [Exophiala xenobiotica]|nr:hypothetical protein LTS06_002891 [Exophiala xenobiotica]KAK5288208.1 hypothetical protein LTR14_008545 [Exophiala xenobiotica]KAK5348269.1 hypothetical protein LTR61_008127 [Exophiala xenobiotica]KAK5362767.1 hypothetical protein LTR11_009457 [Exophiala xenobiotica]KAK5366074.1 hypothetical protein LTS03_008833 [Exophiala xenobiotica]
MGSNRRSYRASRDSHPESQRENWAYFVYQYDILIQRNKEIFHIPSESMQQPIMPRQGKSIYTSPMKNIEIQENMLKREQKLAQRGYDDIKVGKRRFADLDLDEIECIKKDDPTFKLLLSNLKKQERPDRNLENTYEETERLLGEKGATLQT